MNWKVNSKKSIFKCRFFELRVEDCTTPSGTNIEDYYVLNCSDWVQVIAQDEKGQFIMVEQYRHGGKKTFLEFPGGVVDKGESVEATASRELLEETGYEAGHMKYLGADFPNPAFQENKLHLFLATSCVKVTNQNLDEGEEINIKIINSEKLSEVIEQGGSHALMLYAYLKFKYITREV